MDYVIRLLPSLLEGFRMTLVVFALTLILSLPLGLAAALGRISRIAPIRWLCSFYVWLFRGTPLMLQLLFFYYGLGIIGNTMVLHIGSFDFSLKFLIMNSFQASILTFALNYGAYFCEIIRAGIQSIDRGQYEAAKTLGFSRWQTMRMIIIPQTIKRILPPVSNETITLVKDTALVFVIALPELIKAAKDAANRDVNTTAYFLAAVIFLLFTLVLTVISSRLEKRFSRFEGREERA